MIGRIIKFNKKYHNFTLLIHFMLNDIMAMPAYLLKYSPNTILGNTSFVILEPVVHFSLLHCSLYSQLVSCHNIILYHNILKCHSCLLLLREYFSVAWRHQLHREEKPHSVTSSKSIKTLNQLSHKKMLKFFD